MPKKIKITKTTPVVSKSLVCGTCNGTGTRRVRVKSGPNHKGFYTLDCGNCLGTGKLKH